MDRDILLVNMGGPETLADIKPYLRAIFSDPRILPMPAPIRSLVRELIAWRRTPKVRKRYEALGGGSPLPEWTRKQVDVLRGSLNGHGEGIRITHAFRYTSPTIQEALFKLRRDGRKRVLLVPMFPHSTKAMTGSVVAEAVRQASRLGIDLAHLPAWGLHPEVIELQRAMVSDALEQAGPMARILFVAHGIPQRNVDAGEDYPDQVRENAKRIMQGLPEEIDWTVSFQSRLGPVEWTRPYIEDELRRLCVSPEPLVIVPLSFVADCLETIHDLDTEASAYAHSHGVQTIVRVPAYNDDPRFGHVLADILQEMDHV